MGHFRHGCRAGMLPAVLTLSFLILTPLGCSSRGDAPPDPSAPIVRVRLMQNVNRVTVSASQSPVVSCGSAPAGRALNFPSSGADVVLTPGGWRIGNLDLGSGELVIQPSAMGSVSVDRRAYRGRYRLVPVGPGVFDVVNDVDIEGYLKGVLPRELPWNWHDETYRAQAIVARTYALYEKQAAQFSSQPRHFDLHPDERSQMYGGLAAESKTSRRAVDATAGIVLAYGPAGAERIFKAYFSSCCGGVSQSNVDAFPNESYIEPLSDQDQHGLCNASPKFNWGPIEIRKDELTRRFRIWGSRRNRPEKDMAVLARIDVQVANRFGRPTRFVVTDVRGNRYSYSGEEIRWAINTDAAPGSTVFSSFFKVVDDLAASTIRFVEGHGWGHGVGMCQWCAQRRAEDGMRHEDIALSAYPNAILKRAY